MSTTAPAVRFRAIGDVLAAVPALLGFHPQDSLVLICLDHQGQVQVAVRADLPQSADEPPLAAQLAQCGPVRGAHRVLAVVVSEQDRPTLRDHLHATLAAREIGLRSFLLPAFTAGTRWRCLDGDNAGASGALPDPDANALRAHGAVTGRVVHGSREEIADLFAPDDDAAVARRAAAITAALASPLPTSEQSAEVVREALRAAHRGELDFTDTQVAQLAIALSDPRVRDAALATAVPDTTPIAQAARAMWTCLTRLTPAPERAEPAVLAGYVAYLAGDGATARVALDTARAADPAHVLSRLLTRALDNAVPPTKLAGLAGHDDVGLSQALEDNPDPDSSDADAPAPQPGSSAATDEAR